MGKYVLAVNSGSSSVKCSLFSLPDFETVAKITCERIGTSSPAVLSLPDGTERTEELSEPTLMGGVGAAIRLLKTLPLPEGLLSIKGIGHRIVQGGSLFSDSCVLDEEAEEKILSLVPLAPLHNPANLTCYKAFASIMPGSVGEVAVFDTTLYKDLPPEEYTLPIPYEVAETYGIRRYGAHGISHGYLIRRYREDYAINQNDRVITMHIGSGCSLSAFDGKKCVATSMGLTPLGGVMMGTRTGDMDPSVVTYLEAKMKATPGAMSHMLTKTSGLLGVSGVSNDVRDLLRASEEGNRRAELALSMFISRIADFVGSYYIKLGGLDSLVFSGGVFENSALLREKLGALLYPALRLKIDPRLNETVGAGGEGVITAPDSAIKGVVIPTAEEKMIAFETARVLRLEE